MVSNVGLVLAMQWHKTAVNYKNAPTMVKNGRVTMRFEFMEVRFGGTRGANKNTVVKHRQPRTTQITGARSNAILSTG